ncbi:MAG: helix-turn-helix transcriptional regulator [Coleofasciculus sp. A1-SPW-01]|nr:helix-turn-helix transcriptional regulator [Coleofasciculus chthonoplastes]
MMTLREKFGADVRARREELGFSQEQLAELAGMHRTYVGSIERGERNISLENIVKLCEALQIKPSSLMGSLDEFVNL